MGRTIYQRSFLTWSLCTILLSLACAQTRKTNIIEYLPHPEELGPWHLVDSARVFVGEDLYTLIDGGADIYFEYGFHQVVAAEYQNNQGLSIKLEMYKMSDAAAAYGMYSINIGSQGKKIQIGTEGILNEYYLMFWKDIFLVFLSTADTTSESSAGILVLATMIDRRLKTHGNKPVLLNYLPEKGLITSKFVRGILGLSSIYTFNTKNIFGMKEGVVGGYSTHNVFILKYNSDKEAKEKYQNAQRVLSKSNRFSNFKELTGSCTMTDDKDSQLCITYFKNLIVAVIAEQKRNAPVICNDVVSFIQQH